MEQAIEEFNKLYPHFEVLPFEDTCEIIETAPASEKDFKRLVLTHINGYVFPREFAGATISFFVKAESPNPMRLNSDGIFFSDIDGRKCLFVCELKSSFDTTQIFHAREQIIGTLLRLRAKVSMQQTQPNWEYHGIIASYKPTMDQLIGINKLTSNDAKFSKHLISKKHKMIKGEIANNYYKPLAIPDIEIHYVGVPNRNNEFQLDLKSLLSMKN